MSCRYPGSLFKKKRIPTSAGIRTAFKVSQTCAVQTALINACRLHEPLQILHRRRRHRLHLPPEPAQHPPVIYRFSGKGAALT